LFNSGYTPSLTPARCLPCRILGEWKEGRRPSLSKGANHQLMVCVDWSQACGERKYSELPQLSCSDCSAQTSCVPLSY